MSTFVAIAVLAALFVVFGMFRPGAGRGCGNCACEGGTCEREESG